MHENTAQGTEGLVRVLLGSCTALVGDQDHFKCATAFVISGLIL